MQQILDHALNTKLWIFLVVVIVTVLMINRLVHWILVVRLRHSKPEKHIWRQALLSALNAPVRVIVWLIGVVVIKYKCVPAGTEPLIDQVFLPAIGVLVTLAVTWFLLRFVDRAKGNYLARATVRNETVDQTAVNAISKLSWAVILVFALISILQQIGVSLSSLLAVGGAAGIAVGFASQTLVANLFGGLTIYASRIFRIGEDIILPGNNVSGTVQQIGWRSTLVLGWDGKPVYVPNSVFNSSNLVNHSRMVHRSFSENLLLHYRDFDKVERVVEEGNEMLAKRDDLNYFVLRFDSFGDTALKLNVYAWPQMTPKRDFVPYAEFARIKEEVLLTVAGIALDHGCELIQPLSYVYLRDEDSSTQDTE